MLVIIIMVLVVLHRYLPPDQFKVAVIISVIAFILLSIILWIIILRSLKNPDSKIARETILFSEERSSEGFQTAPDEYKKLLGARGLALSQLRPSGIALVKGKRISVVTEGGFIPADSAVEVVDIQGSRVVVRRIIESPDQD